MGPGKKRASPGAEASKNGSAIENEVVLSEEDAKRLTDIGKEIANAELVLGMSQNNNLAMPPFGADATVVRAERRAQAYLEPFYSKRRPILKSIPKFWPQALSNMGGIALHMQHKQDQDAILYLEDLWLERDKTEPRCFTLEFVGFFRVCFGDFY
jgi:template-activating factor I